jgi:hypothetical protein
MSHAVLVNDGLLSLVIASALLLAVFVAAVIRAPPESAGPPGRHAGDTGQAGDPGYQPRHAASGAPPWGPAPKPPGIGRDGPG